MTGKFIVIDGCDGAGKTTQTRLLQQKLEERGLSVIATREPGGSRGGEQIRELLLSGETDHWDRLTELFLFNAARRDHLRTKVKPALEQGIWVICDRFVDSTYAYQGARGVLASEIRAMHELCKVNMPEPDLTLVLGVDPEMGLERTKQRRLAATRFEKEDLEYHKRVWQIFRERAAIASLNHAWLSCGPYDAEKVSKFLFEFVCKRLQLQDNKCQ